MLSGKINSFVTERKFCSIIRENEFYRRFDLNFRFSSKESIRYYATHTVSLRSDMFLRP